ncbi:1-aminocyclopropane-1-carboxylate deaminase/D-cysteine desulfhydrase [Sediminibacterium soli]|uniref:1-aminocyclopropane-1-carboxylate deaminase/D-cysteine desulfhydrase n=1 Tax=Sediminibacterium soli TaxID=2698829 RepID=UPI00137A69F6|nr:pyridoxal-phosphate dependent enzyme [Sediminibacterium soli]NCI45922.1 pyridoxal-phosphate dependent enzyme [Sediminibacterium soli]
MQENPVTIDNLNSLASAGISVHILRIDRVHPVVSGNKWFKLSPYLRQAWQEGAHTIATFGGAYSNHIVAAAFAAREKGLQSIGFIRGEAAGSQPTLEEARSYGMQLRFVERDRYRNKEALVKQHTQPGWHWVPEGGYGLPGAEGAAAIVTSADTQPYSHILCAVGTGTMMAGLVKAAKPDQTVIGIPVLKNPGAAQEMMGLLTAEERNKSFAVVPGYDFGGYAKHPPALLAFMREIWDRQSLPTDIVYTSKMVFAAQDLVKKQYFPPGSRLLLIHSGGLQGNRSLPPHSLPF